MYVTDYLLTISAEACGSGRWWVVAAAAVGGGASGSGGKGWQRQRVAEAEGGGGRGWRCILTVSSLYRHCIPPKRVVCGVLSPVEGGGLWWWRRRWRVVVVEGGGGRGWRVVEVEGGAVSSLYPHCIPTVSSMYPHCIHPKRGVCGVLQRRKMVGGGGSDGGGWQRWRVAEYDAVYPLYPDCILTVSLLYSHCILTVSLQRDVCGVLRRRKVVVAARVEKGGGRLCMTLYPHCIPTVSSLYPYKEWWKAVGRVGGGGRRRVVDGGGGGWRCILTVSSLYPHCILTVSSLYPCIERCLQRQRRRGRKNEEEK